MRAKFADLKYAGGAAACNAEAKEPWLTAEQIPVKDNYTAADLEGMEHLNYAAGLAPFLRGPYSTMYVMRPWTIRQYAGFSTAEESRSCSATRLFLWLPAHLLAPRSCSRRVLTTLSASRAMFSKH